MTRGAESVALVPALFEARTRRVKEPLTVGRPEMTPVEGFSLRPEGNPVAE
jgi:hypothetical protein